MRITIDIQNDSEYEFIKQLFANYPFRLKYELETETQLSDTEKQKHWETIKKGGDGKSIKNPLRWQKETRKDRNLPFEI